MAKPRKQENAADRLGDLAALASKLNIPDDALDGELEDACDSAARLQFETIREAVMLEKLEFLMSHGYQLGRLRQLIEDAGISS